MPWRFVQLIVAVSAVIVVMGCSPGGSRYLDSATFDELNSVLEQATATVSLPTGWTVETTDVSFGGLGYHYIEGAPDGGNREKTILVSAAPIGNLVTPNDPEASLQVFLARHVVGKGGRTVADPIATTISGVDGYLFEVEGLDVEGTPFAGFVATLYGTQYHYLILAEFPAADRDEMNSLWRNVRRSVVFTDPSTT